MLHNLILLGEFIFFFSLLLFVSLLVLLLFTPLIRFILVFFHEKFFTPQPTVYELERSFMTSYMRRRIAEAQRLESEIQFWNRTDAKPHIINWKNEGF